MWNLEEETEEYNRAIRSCHKRAAQRILAGCLANGGLYVKLGQGLNAMNHILPREYIDTLVVLQDKALHRGPDEVGQVSPASEEWEVVRREGREEGLGSLGNRKKCK